MYSFYSLDSSSISMMPARFDESNKGSYGKLLCICGSNGMCGAAYLSAKAAYRTGAGLVRILTSEDNRIPLQTALPEAIVSTYGDTLDFATVFSAVEWADVLVIGCGLGTTPLSRSLLSTVLRAKGDKPAVIDADALNIISSSPALKKHLKGTVVTPHPLEASRLTGYTTEHILEKAEEVAGAFAREYDCVCLIKRHSTVVSDGSDEIYLNKSGNHGMATGGSGDVLAGIIGGILAQNKKGELSLRDAAALGTYIHGLAGDAAAEELGEYSLMASDIINALPKILKCASK